MRSQALPHTRLCQQTAAAKILFAYVFNCHSYETTAAHYLHKVYLRISTEPLGSTPPFLIYVAIIGEHECVVRHIQSMPSPDSWHALWQDVAPQILIALQQWASVSCIKE